MDSWIPPRNVSYLVPLGIKSLVDSEDALDRRRRRRRRRARDGAVQVDVHQNPAALENGAATQRVIKSQSCVGSMPLDPCCNSRSERMPVQSTRRDGPALEKNFRSLGLLHETKLREALFAMPTGRNALPNERQTQLCFEVLSSLGNFSAVSRLLLRGLGASVYQGFSNHEEGLLPHANLPSLHMVPWFVLARRYEAELTEEQTRCAGLREEIRRRTEALQMNARQTAALGGTWKHRYAGLVFRAWRLSIRQEKRLVLTMTSKRKRIYLRGWHSRVKSIRQAQNEGHKALLLAEQQQLQTKVVALEQQLSNAQAKLEALQRKHRRETRRGGPTVSHEPPNVMREASPHLAAIHTAAAAQAAEKDPQGLVWSQEQTSESPTFSLPPAPAPSGNLPLL